MSNCDVTTVLLPFGIVAGVSSAGLFLPMTAWRGTDGVNLCRSQGEMRGKGAASCTVTVYCEYTNDVRVPAARTAIGNSINANGMLDPAAATDLTLTLSTYRYCRFGWFVVGDNTNLGICWMGGLVTIRTS